MAVGTLCLPLPCAMILVLNKCYYVPALSMNIVSGFCLLQDRYSFKSETNGCSIYMDDIFYVHAPDRNGLFILDLNCNDSHINNINSKRCRFVDDNSTYMPPRSYWHQTHEGAP